MNDRIELRIQISPSEELDEERIQTIASTLRTELRAIDDVDSVDFARDSPAPADAMGGDPVTLGTLLVALASSGGVFSAVIDTLKARLTRSDVTEVTINGNTLKINGLNDDQKEKLLKSFMKKS